MTLIRICSDRVLEIETHVERNESVNREERRQRDTSTIF